MRIFSATINSLGRAEYSLKCARRTLDRDCPNRRHIIEAIQHLEEALEKHEEAREAWVQEMKE